MEWVVYTILALVGLVCLGIFMALIEAEIKKRREAKAQRDWEDKVRRER